MRVAADLSFSIDLPNPANRPSRCNGRVEADGSVVSVVFDPMPSLVVPSARSLARPLAHQLDRVGLTVQIVGPDGPLVRVGAGVEAPRWQRIATRGAPIQLVSIRALLRSLTGPRIFKVALPSATALPRFTASRSRLAGARSVARQVRQQISARRR